MKSDGWGLVVACGWAACLCACHAQADIVASCGGVYDPAHPPQVLPIDGIKGKDPCLFRSGDTYWLFATGPGFLVYKSTDHLGTFQKQDPVFASNPAWIASSMPQVTVTDLWSPQVIEFGNTIHLYYTASAFKSGKSCIGHARTHSLDQPFEDSGKPMLCATTGVDSFDAVDPAPVLDDLGNPWMVFGSFNDGIHLMALDQTGERLDDKMPILAARPAGLQAAFIYRGPAYYYLFVSFDPSPGHSLHVGRSQQVTGPYVDQAGKDMRQGGGTLLLQSNTTFIGPGSNSVLDDNGCALNAYHVYASSDSTGSNPFLRIAPLVFDADGWPVTAGP